MRLKKLLFIIICYFFILLIICCDMSPEPVLEEHINKYSRNINEIASFHLELLPIHRSVRIKATKKYTSILHSKLFFHYFFHKTKSDSQIPN